MGCLSPALPHPSNPFMWPGSSPALLPCTVERAAPDPRRSTTRPASSPDRGQPASEDRGARVRPPPVQGSFQEVSASKVMVTVGDWSSNLRGREQGARGPGGPAGLGSGPFRSDSVSFLLRLASPSPERAFNPRLARLTPLPVPSLEILSPLRQNQEGCF